MNDKGRWWQGQRGEWYVLVQMILFILILFGPQSAVVMPTWLRALGGVMILFGGALAGLALLNLGPNLTPLPYPKEDGSLVQAGAYALVRHPIYSGLIFASFGLGLVRGTLTGLLYALLLFIFFDLKTRREESWLGQKYADYGDYQQRVRKLIPFVY